MDRTLKEKLVKVAHRLTRLGIAHKSPELMATFIRAKALKEKGARKTKLNKLAKLLEDHNEWCWGDISEETRKMQGGRDAELMQAWLESIQGNKILLKYTKKYRNPEDYPEIPKELWGEN